jgi:hypothetical protein
MDEIISYNMCAVKVRNAKLRNYLKFKNYAFMLYFHFRCKKCQYGEDEEEKKQGKAGIKTFLGISKFGTDNVL